MGKKHISESKKKKWTTLTFTILRKKNTTEREIYNNELKKYTQTVVEKMWLSNKKGMSSAYKFSTKAVTKNKNKNTK